MGTFAGGQIDEKKGINPYEIGNLERLAIVGAFGMGALTYHPAISLETSSNEMTLDDLSMG